MVNDAVLLSKLPPFKNEQRLIADNQSTNDIVKGILLAHDHYADQYKRIAPYFVGNTAKQTIENIFDFLKSHVRYVIEPGIKQTIKSPAAIISTGARGSDCKNYSLFTAGILRAINRLGLQNIPYAFRFAGYRFGSDEIEHVFIVAWPGTKKETWIDPVLRNLDNREKWPNITKDYKFNDMALYGISGINQHNRVGFIDPATLTAISAGLNQVSKLFAKRPNPNDWKRWQPGDAIHWTLNDGDSVQNEAHNIQQYLANNLNNDLVLQQYWSKVKTRDLQSKFQRAGARQEDLQAFVQSQPKPAGLFSSGGGGGSLFTQNNGATRAGSNMWLTLGLIGAAAAIFISMNKKRR